MAKNLTNRLKDLGKKHKASQMGKKIIVTRLPDEMANLLKAGLVKKGAGLGESVAEAVKACDG